MLFLRISADAVDNLILIGLEDFLCDFDEHLFETSDRVLGVEVMTDIFFNLE